MMYSPTSFNRTTVVDALSSLRQEWAEAAEGENLMQVKASVGLLLSDIALALGLSTLEQIQVFGAELALELVEVLAPKPGSNGRH